MSARSRLHPTASRDHDRSVKEFISRVQDDTPRRLRGGRRFAAQTEPPPWVVPNRRPVPQIGPPAPPTPSVPSAVPVPDDADLMAAQLVAEVEDALRRRGVEADLVEQVMVRLRGDEQLVREVVPMWRRGVAVSLIVAIVWQTMGVA